MTSDIFEIELEYEDIFIDMYKISDENKIDRYLSRRKYGGIGAIFLAIGLIPIIFSAFSINIIGQTFGWVVMNYWYILATCILFGLSILGISVVLNKKGDLDMEKIYYHRLARALEEVNNDNYESSLEFSSNIAGLEEFTNISKVTEEVLKSFNIFIEAVEDSPEPVENYKEHADYVLFEMAKIIIESHTNSSSFEHRTSKIEESIVDEVNPFEQFIRDLETIAIIPAKSFSVFFGLSVILAFLVYWLFNEPTIAAAIPSISVGAFKIITERID